MHSHHGQSDFFCFVGEMYNLSSSHTHLHFSYCKPDFMHLSSYLFIVTFGVSTMTRGILANVLGKGKKIAAYMNLYFSEVPMEFDQFTKMVITPSLTRCQKDFLPALQPDDPILLPLVQSTEVTNQSDAAAHQHNDGLFIPLQMHTLSQLLVSDFYDTAEQKGNIVLYLNVTLEYYERIKEGVMQHICPHLFCHVQFPNAWKGDCYTYLCINARFEAAPMVVTLSKLVDDENFAKEVLIDKLKKDFFTLTLKGIQQSIKIDVADVVKGHLVAEYAPLSDRGN